MAKLVGDTKITKSEISQTIDLSEELGVDVSSQPRLVQEIGQALLERMIERTVDENKDINGRKFPKYSKSYQESDEFEFYNKDPSDINLELTGAMIESLDFEQSGSKVTFDIESGQTGKAYGHISGFEGHPTIKNGKKRNFFGAIKKDLKEIKKEFRSDIKRIKDGTNEVIRQDEFFTEESISDSAFRSIFRDVFFNSNTINLGDGES